LSVLLVVASRTAAPEVSPDRLTAVFRAEGSTRSDVDRQVGTGLLQAVAIGAGATFAAESSDRWWIAFDGAAHNRDELRRELRAVGRRPGPGDASLVAEAFGQWGPVGALSRINGEWGIVAWDDATRELVLCRDRFGSSSLFYAVTGAGTVVVGDTLRLFPAAGFEDLDRATFLYSNYLWETTSHTPLKGVRSVPPGTLVRIGAGCAPQVLRWWRTIDHIGPRLSSSASTTGALRELVLESVRVRLPQTESFATSVSGGLDSSVIAVAIDRVLREQGDDPGRQNLHHQSYVGSPQDELRYAQAVADRLGLPLFDTGVDASTIVQHLTRAILAFEGDHFMPLSVWWHFHQIHDRGFQQSFEGLMADSLFAGTNKARDELRRAALFRGRFLRWGALASEPVGDGSAVRVRGLGHRLGDDLRDGLSRHSLSQFMRRQRYRNGAAGWLIGPLADLSRRTSRDSSLRDEVEALESAISEREAEIAEESVDLPPLDRILYRYAHMNAFPPDARNFRRLATDHDVSLVCPFMDPRLVTFAYTLPEESKIGGGWSKRVLRDAFADVLPSEVVWRRRKLGFTAPMLAWTAEVLAQVMIERVTSELWSSDGDRSVVARRVLDAGASGDILSLRRLWPQVQQEMLVKGLLARPGALPGERNEGGQ
jgi:asparagine synthase (glutamine-hydrolysing)